MKKTIIFIILSTIIMMGLSVPVRSEELKGKELYSLSACMIDGESGRILYDKNSGEVRANASTTKIMTCIIALEYGNMDDIVTVSKYAAGMPDVQLNICEGEQYRLGDLMYSMMLESHNDSAVAIAEHIGGNVEEFAKLMNDKAKEIGCYDTYFITPNGLDATKLVKNRQIKHSTTASDLTKIMAYCIKNKQFTDITTTRSYSFKNKIQDEKGNIKDGDRCFSVYNKNALLDKMKGVISGKTGFTNEAGYCYVCAVENEGRVFVIALLGCGWPNNKQYKWSDTRRLIEYGIMNYKKKDICNYDLNLEKIKVKDGIEKNNKTNKIFPLTYANVFVQNEEIEMLIKDDDKIKCMYKLKKELQAPVKINEIVGKVEYYVNGEKVKTYPVMTTENVEKISYKYVTKKIIKEFIIK